MDQGQDVSGQVKKAHIPTFRPNVSRKSTSNKSLLHGRENRSFIARQSSGRLKAMRRARTIAWDETYEGSSQEDVNIHFPAASFVTLKLARDRSQQIGAASITGGQRDDIRHKLHVPQSGPGVETHGTVAPQHIRGLEDAARILKDMNQGDVNMSTFYSPPNRSHMQNQELNPWATNQTSGPRTPAKLEAPGNGFGDHAVSTNALNPFQSSLHSSNYRSQLNFIPAVLASQVPKPSDSQASHDTESLARNISPRLDSSQTDPTFRSSLINTVHQGGTSSPYSSWNTGLDRREPVELYPYRQPTSSSDSQILDLGENINRRLPHVNPPRTETFELGNVVNRASPSEFIWIAPTNLARAQSTNNSDTRTMAPVRDPNSVEGTLKDTVQTLYEVQSQVHGFVPETQPLLIDKMTELTRSLAHLQNITSPTASPDNPIHKQHVAPEIIDYVDDGRNPDIYNRDFVELVQRGNAVINGKQQAFRDFSQIFAQALKDGFGDMDEQVDKIMDNAGLTSKTAGQTKTETGPANGASNS